MKTLIAFIIFLSIASSASSQTVNNIPIKEIDADYIEIVGVDKFLNNRIIIEIDFGQKQKLWGNSKSLKDAEGKNIEFNSMVEALNFMSSNGFEFVQAYSFSNNNANITKYLLRKIRTSKT